MKLFSALIVALVLILFMVSDAKKKKTKKKVEAAQQQANPNPPDPLANARSPRDEGLYRDGDNGDLPAITEQVTIKEGIFFYGTAMGTADGKVVPQTLSDGAAPRVKTFLKDFKIDIHTVTNRQFKAFVEDTNYVTDSELYKWSFVLEGLTSQAVVDEVDGEHGYGRVKESLHWMAVKRASWKHPYGPDSSITDYLDYPVVHMSYRDADEYCSWAGGDPRVAVAKEKAAGTWTDDKDENGKVDLAKSRHFYRLPTEREWERVARAGLVNQTYSWGDDKPSSNAGADNGNGKKTKKNLPMFNHWPGAKFEPKNKKQIRDNVAIDGFHGLAPAKHYLPSDFGVYQMLGNVWEWANGGTPDKRPLRGGSFIDSINGEFNHATMVSTRQMNSGDSGSVNTGFRCVFGGPLNLAIDQRDTQIAEQLLKETDGKIKKRQAEQRAEKKRLKEEEDKKNGKGKSKGKGKGKGKIKDKARGKGKGKGDSKMAATKEPEEASMTSEERFHRKKAAKEAQRKAEEERQQAIKRARRDTTGIKMEL
jgi:formylglycine-generating enzyme required for sulfatase activity